METRESFPESLRAICGVHSQPPDNDEVDLSAGYADEVDDVLLSKEANSEQLEIARRLSRYGAVRVQGPPGTGKTHTIANLVGHLLAQGRSVLVTSHTTKALRVLREKIADQLQPLCVSVLEGDAESRAQLADSVTRIGDRLGSTTRDELLRQATDLRSHRESCLETVRGLRSRLLAAVSADYAEITVAGRSWTTEQAGKLVAAGSGIHDWIPGTIEGRLPLTPMEVEALYRTNAQLSSEEERWVAGSLPELDSMVPPEVLERELREIAKTQASSDLAFGSELWTVRAGSVAQLRSLADDIETALRDQGSHADSRFAAIAAGAASTEEQRPWRELAALLEAASETSGEQRRATMTSNPRLPAELSPEDELRALREMQAHLKKGGSFGWLTLKTHGAWNKILAGASCIGAPPWTAEALTALASVPAAHLSWERVKARWPLVMGPFGEALPGSETQADEAACLQIARQLLEAVELPKAVIAPLASRAHELGLDWGRFAPETGIEFPNAVQWRGLIERIASTAPRALRAEAARRERDERLDRLDYAALRLRQEPLTQQPGSPAQKLLSALQASDSEAYASAFADMIALRDSKEALAKRLDFLTRLERQAKDWAAALRNRVPPHDRDSTPGDVQSAWEWKLVRQELVVRSAEDLDDLIRAIETAKQDLRLTTIQLIDRLAWAGQISRTTPEAKQALQIWLNTVKKIGKGTGRNVPLLRRAAQESMAIARDAVPVWIAPLSRVAESFDARTSSFDVVIIDEASQSDVLGLIALYLGDKIIVVGDDQQVTPAAVGERLDTANQLIASYLQGIPGSHLYDGTYSIYEIAGTAFSGVTQLREHFRCVPDIIRFSNSLSYDWRIIPLRDPSSAMVKPPVIYEHVTSAQSDERLNREEALHVASLVLAASEQPEYSGLTFGVISMLGAEQSRSVEILLRNNLRLDEYDKRRVVCGAPPQFQGDERDVIFMSLVDAPSPDGGPLPRRGDPGDLWKKRYNVAASRARDQLWVVTSLDSSRDLQTDDLRWRLIEFAKNPSGLQSRIAQAQARSESPLESEVISRLVTAGYQVTPQVGVGAYRIDLVVSDGKRKLAIECDGDRYHTQENLQSDLERQAQLERMGWRFVRIRGSEFFRDPARTMDPLFKRLSDLGIRTGSDREEDGGAGDSDELVARVRARAAEWKQELRESRTSGSVRARRGRRFGLDRSSPRESESSPAKPDTTGANSVPGTVAAPIELTPRQRPLPLPASNGRALSVPSGGSALAELRAVLEAGGFRVEDLRTKGGAFWVYDREKQLDNFITELKSHGLKFQYSVRRAGWFCK